MQKRAHPRQSLRWGLALAAALSAGPGVAQITVDQQQKIMAHLLNEVEKTRGICVGTVQECEAKKKPEALDMVVTFELASAVLTEEAKENLKIYAAILVDERLQRANFRVEGHTDARGSDDYNLDLSRARAQAVKEFLVEYGLPVTRLTADGFGEERPRADSPADPSNRRVELVVDAQ